jgi:uncharacterized membrane protein
LRGLAEAKEHGLVLAFGWYEIIKFLHVLLAIVAVGFNATYGVWLARAARQPEYEEFTLRGVKLLDDRFANPAYALLLVTGLLMVWIGDLDLTQFWLLAALVLYAIAVILASIEFQALSRRGTALGIVLAVDVIVIVFLMVTQPTL